MEEFIEDILVEKTKSLTFIILWANSADNRLVIFFLFCIENKIWHFIQIVSIGDNLHELFNLVF